MAKSKAKKDNNYLSIVLVLIAIGVLVWLLLNTTKTQNAPETNQEIYTNTDYNNPSDETTPPVNGDTNNY